MLGVSNLLTVERCRDHVTGLLLWFAYEIGKGIRQSSSATPSRFCLPAWCSSTKCDTVERLRMLGGRGFSAQLVP